MASRYAWARPHLLQAARAVLMLLTMPVRHAAPSLRHLLSTLSFSRVMAIVLLCSSLTMSAETSRDAGSFARIETGASQHCVRPLILLQTRTFTEDHSS
ncbi:uncharacterized protein EV422DRAFT_526815 [Fimicolochytrium jonesii]|uniref:uncharacterized protein n=1 Tax=Fimicolochytrium jonesii TaxID=1396493 RepID=UPI0022FE5D68|nr:uncharacterized protein EV422DRAFT_526815 [Fimicolochytrium jonesii]KAI8821755.1 hypothetical protein EV422DRAFT_526815 [Fimicolochytrium jonesii]